MLSVLGTVGITLARMTVGTVLLTAGIAKLKVGQNHFLAAVLGYDVVSGRMAAIIAHWVPWTEVAVGALLLVGFLTRWAASLAIGLLALFSGAISFSLVRGMDNECGCLDKLTPLQWRLVYRNMSLMGLLIVVYALNGGSVAVDGWFGGWLELSQEWTSAGLTALVIFWVLGLLATLLLHRLSRVNTTPSQPSRPEHQTTGVEELG